MIYFKLSSYILSHSHALITKLLSLSSTVFYPSLYLMLQSSVMVHTFYHQLQKARRKHGQLSHSEPFLSPSLLLTASAALCFPYSNLLLLQVIVFLIFVLLVGATATFPRVRWNTPSVQLQLPRQTWWNFISLKPDRSNRVICSPTLLLLLVAALVPESHKTQPVEKQMHLKAWTDGSILVSTDLRPGMDRAYKEGWNHRMKAEV